MQTAKDIKSYWFARLSLTTIAALTPQDIEVAITDENVETIDFNEEVDLVGLTAMTMHATRAYEIADRFRERGITVVMGGLHASSLPHEAKEHVDAVVIGEAEHVWGDLLHDFQQGQLKPFYKSDHFCSLIKQPHPRLDLLNKNNYWTINCVQATRGCPFSCDFCSVAQFFGDTYRYRPVDDVVEEIKSLPPGYCAFVDDNIMGKPSYAKELFQKLTPLKRKWTSQGSLTMAKDPALLRMAVESGCYALFVGIETLSQDNLSSMNKSINNVSRYEDAIKKIRDHGIMVIGSFIFGFDHDDDAVFERTVRFCEKNRIDLPIFFILTPVPGTRLYKRMEADGRILHKDWSKYNGSNVVFKPKLLSEETLFNGYNWAFQEAYSHSSIAKRVLFPPQQRRVPNLLINYAFRRMVMRAPKGKVTIISKLLNTLNTSIPIKDRKNLIPTFVDTTVEKSQQLLKDASKMLKVNAIHNERFRTLIIKLEGSLDLSAAKQLMKRLKGSLTKEQNKIIIDFNGIKHLSPKAAQLLVMKNVEKLSQKRNQIEVRNFQQIATGAFTNITNLISDGENSEEERIASQEIDSQTFHDHL
jgi:radical SAM superfamily enzyme YgiQ (UPF0313 family)/anti-anti-sigma regulatory factor